MRTRNHIRLLLMAAALALALPFATRADVSLSVVLAPPPLPVYVQPPCPAPGYMWTPGYWAWEPDGYYWVPGTWVEPPAVGLFWTPGYWAWSSGVYLWSPGYWGPQVGFYGGVVYGCGYDGDGFEGGYWRGSRFYYNTAVTNVNTTVIRNVYRRPVPERGPRAVSYNGGPGGISARPTREQARAAHERHWAPTGAQRRQERAARSEPSLRVAVNHGRPPIAATARPGAFKGRDAVAAKGASHGAAEHGRRSANHPYSQDRGRKEARPSPSARSPFTYGRPPGHRGEAKRAPETTPGHGAPRRPESGYQAPRTPRPYARRAEPRPYEGYPAPHTYARRQAQRSGAWYYSGAPNLGHPSRPAPVQERRGPAGRPHYRR